MLQLNFAPSLDLLIPVLMQEIRRVWLDPFKPPTVIVPSPAVGKWLKMRMADCPVCPELALGCIANIEMQTLERFFWKVLRPEENTQQPLGVTVMQQVICALLDESLLKNSSYQSVRSYLMDSGGAIDPVKRVQLASKIARQFQEYEFNRPSVWDNIGGKWRLCGIDATWLQKKSYSDANDGNEAWQKDLYCKTNACLGRASSDNVKYISLPHLYRLRREEGLNNGGPWSVEPDHIFLFGVSKVSHFHRTTLVEISQMKDVDMHVFLTNPCAEFWEDVDTHRSSIRRSWKHDSGEKAGITARSPGDYQKEDFKEIAQLPRDHSLLELWGNAGKANIFLWCAQAEWNFNYHSPGWVENEDAPKTLLKALQYSLLRRIARLPGCENGSSWKGAVNDGSLMILACPDPSREVEELREHILDLVQGGKINRLNEIVVYLPDPAAYIAQIHRVFGAWWPDDPEYIPYCILGAPGSDSIFSQGMHTLFEIIEGRFDRARVFALLRNPIVQATRKISPDDVTVWEGWAEELGIFRGFNKKHREQMGDKGRTITDVHTFELGTARLLIGNLAAGPTDLKCQLLADDGNEAFSPVPPFRDFDTSDAGSVEQFCGLAEDLYTDTKRLAELIAERPLSEAVDAIRELTEKWFGTIPEGKDWSMTAEALVKDEFLKGLPIIKLQNGLAAPQKCVVAKELIALVKECLPEELPAGSKAWTGGITFAPLRPAMIVPHRVVFALGLNATAFPGTNEKPTWDLLTHKPIVGDSDRVRDNRFAFLELLHAAQERLILSFRSRNMQKEEELQPSSVVLELESYLKDQGLKTVDEGSREERCLIRRDIPWIVHETLDAAIKGGREHGSWDPAHLRLARLESEAGGKTPNSRYEAGKEHMKNETTGPLRTDIYNLRKFFANPLEYHLSKTLGIELDESAGTMGATDEPLQSGALEMSGLQKKIWTELLEKVFPENAKDAGVDSAALESEAGEIAKKVHRDYIILGGSPEAQLCTMEQQYLLAWARECAQATAGFCATFNDHKLVQGADLSLKRPGVAGELMVDLDDGRKCSVECRHGLVLVPRNNAGTVGIINFKKEGDAKDNPDLWLTGVVQWLAEEMHPQSDKFAIQLVQLNRGDGKEKRISCKISSMKDGNSDRIEDWLCARIREMLIDRCADHLPFAIVQELSRIDDEKRLDLGELTKDNIEEELSREHSAYRCYLEAFKLVDARIPDIKDDKLQELAKARFAPMLEGWIHE